ncbi:hypothetical protein PYW07_009672 [Mythimna separata]|uniref:snRNA-activating protein complex subunit 1 n=1 Tax=Mythimna separata TaxID=271217 RepID=A0AAD7YCA3_MYTSE|nr:hypothetical protein PYW07_009672 [Mythimna separata]
MSLNLQSAYIADGFADDCQELMHRCRRAGTLTFEIFSDIWKDMQLSCVFHGRTSGAELAELSEELLHIAKHCMVADTSNFEESVAGLFLVYALMNLQPYRNFAALRIVQDDIPAIERIELVARRDRRQDVLYVLGSVLIQGPVQYHAVIRERGMEYPIRKYLEGYTPVDKVGIRPRGVFFKQNTELDLIKEINNLTIRYTTAKENIPEYLRDDRNLNYMDPNLPNELETTLKNLISGMIGGDDDDAESSTGCSNHIKNLKNEAMKAPVKPIRHRMGVDDRPKNPSKPEASTSKTDENRPNKRKRKSSSDSDSAKESDAGTMDDLLSDDDLDLTKFDRKGSLDDISDLEFETLEALRAGSRVELVDEMDQASTSGLSTPSTSTADMRKRDSKKTILKSKFKRMGLLPVANFVNK